MKITLYIFCSFALCLSSCVLSGKREAPNSAPDNQAQTKPADGGKTEENKNSAAEGGKAENKAADKAACLNVKAAGRRVDPKQTFAIDFEPFRSSCFVTLHDPEFTDPPLGSEFYVYRDGKEVFKFPNPFNGTTVGCWAEAVAFQDLNSDNLTDIVIAGMCSAKSSPYSENMVYVNTGKDFTTSEDANYKLNDFQKIKDISDFVKRNKEQFFK